MTIVLGRVSLLVFKNIVVIDIFLFMVAEVLVWGVNYVFIRDLSWLVNIFYLIFLCFELQIV